MINPEKQYYPTFKQRKCPWIIEVIEEKFDSAITLLTDDCMLYGGAIRDILADLPIDGDLDVAVPIKEHTPICNKFITSMRWVKLNNSKPDYTHHIRNIQTRKKSVISSVVTYINNNREQVQIITPTMSQMKSFDNIDSGIINIVSNVDIICCGVLMDIFGTVYEIIPGAFDDCEKTIIRFNYNLPIAYRNKALLINRINKLTKRGWKNTINIDNISFL